jgi:hypothetical protein
MLLAVQITIELVVFVAERGRHGAHLSEHAPLPSLLLPVSTRHASKPVAEWPQVPALLGIGIDSFQVLRPPAVVPTVGEGDYP